MPHDFLNKNFNIFREKLLSYSNQFNVSYEAREEMVTDTILAAIDSFDHDKGSFEGYCRVILKNKIFNFMKDKKNLLVITSLDDLEEILPAHEISIEAKENEKSTLMFFEKLKNELNPDELEVFNATMETCDELSKINITKVSEKIGIRTDVAWNIFRKIQRKANKLYKKLKAENIELLFTLEQILIKKDADKESTKNKTKDSDYPRISFQKSVEKSDKDPEYFISKLTENQINKINSMYSDSPPDIPLKKSPLNFFKKLFSKNTK